MMMMMKEDKQLVRYSCRNSTPTDGFFLFKFGSNVVNQMNNQDRIYFKSSDSPTRKLSRPPFLRSRTAKGKLPNIKHRLKLKRNVISSCACTRQILQIKTEQSKITSKIITSKITLLTSKILFILVKHFKKCNAFIINNLSTADNYHIRKKRPSSRKQSVLAYRQHIFIANQISCLYTFSAV